MSDGDRGGFIGRNHSILFQRISGERLQPATLPSLERRDQTRTNRLFLRGVVGWRAMSEGKELKKFSRAPIILVMLFGILVGFAMGLMIGAQLIEDGFSYSGVRFLGIMLTCGAVLISWGLIIWVFIIQRSQKQKGDQDRSPKISD
jgi:hypothetical protein